MFEYLSWEPWLKDGLAHGFCNCTVDFAPKNRLRVAKQLCREFGSGTVLTLKQVHGNEVLDLCREFLELHVSKELIDFQQGDAMIVPWRAGPEKRICCGLVTADCVPLFLRVGDRISLVHAGWRGIAGGVIEAALDRLTATKSDTAEIEGLIGPCAGDLRYQVGDEVISAIGERAVFKKVGMSKYMLNLEATVTRTIEQYCSRQIRLESSQICTISNTSFFSHRREPQNSQRNFSFVLV